MCDVLNSHRWESSGYLGRAPYTVLGFEGTADRVSLNREREAAGLMFTTNPCGGTCAVCGQAIFNVYRIRSADGVEFKVGPNCVAKAGDGGMKRRVKSDVNANNKRVRKAREAARVEEGRRLLLDREVRLQLALVKHSNAYFARQGKTRLDEAEYLLQNGGTAGQLRACFMAEQAAGVVEFGKAVRS